MNTRFADDDTLAHIQALNTEIAALNAHNRALREENERLAQWTGSKLMPLMGTPLAIRFDALDEAQAQENHGQTLDRLRERGGLELSEAAAIREKRKWEPMTHTLALHVLSTPNVEGNRPPRTNDGQE